VTTNCIATFDMFNTAADPAGIGVDSLMQAMLNSFPDPNNFSLGDGLNTAGFVWNTPARFKGPFFLIRGDHKFNDNHNIFARMLWNEYNTTEGDLLNARPALFPGFNPLGEVYRTGQNLAVSYRAVLSPRMVNEFTMGYGRFNFFFALAEASLKGGPQVPYGQECFGTDSTANVDTPFCNTPHTQRAVSTVQFIDNFSYTRGAHAWKTGFNFRFYRHNDSRGVPGGVNMAPTLIMRESTRSPGITAPAGINSNDLDRLEQALVEYWGIVSQVNQVFQANLTDDVYTTDLFTLGTRIKHFDAYVQDEWRIRRDLTLIYGVRWEWKQPAKDCCGRTFVPDKDVLGSQGLVTFTKADSWWGRDNANTFAPRVGLAWNPWGNTKTVVRAGWSMAFDTISSFQVTAIGGKVPGSVLQCFNIVGAAPATGCQPIPTTANGRVSQLMNAVTPFSLPVPTSLPSAQFSPPPNNANTAPDIGAFDPNLQVPTVHEWSLTIQRELPWRMTTEVGYVGKRGLRLYRAYGANQIFTNQPGLLDSFNIARQNIFNGCRADGTGCPSGVTGVTPTLLVALSRHTLGSTSATAGFLNSTTSRNNFLNGALGALSRRIDELSCLSGPAGCTQRIVQQGFPANYFRPNAQFDDIFYFDSGGSSIYHGLILRVQRRFERGLTFNFSYTLSKSIDDMSVDPVAASSGGGLSTTNSRTPTDVRNFALDRTVSDFDNRHVITANVLYELPFGKGRQWAANVPAWANHVIGGWTVTSIVTRQSGEPFTLNAGSSTTTSSNDGRTVNDQKQSTIDVRGPMIQPTLFSLPNVVGPVVYRVGPLRNTLADIGNPNFGCRNVLMPDGTPTSTFFCIPPPGQHGNSGRNSVYGPGFWNVDIGILKNFDITEQVRFQFRAEMFNAFNHANFANPRNASVGSPSLPSTVFGQTCCVADAISSSTTVIANGEPNRVIQFALKISF
jgi:hypothetical protein